jgi:transcriptional regulator with XRE-family HTH domain
MELQQLSVRKVSARIAEKHGGSVYGYTQQVSRILNDPTYDPTLSTVQKILSALNVSLWQVSRAADTEPRSQLQQLNDRFDQLSSDVASLKSELISLQQSIVALTAAVQGDRASSPD